MRKNWDGFGSELFGFTKNFKRCSCRHSKSAIVYEKRVMRLGGLQEVQAIYCTKCGVEL